MKITENHTSFDELAIVTIAVEEQRSIRDSFSLVPDGRFSEFEISLSPQGGFVQPGVLSCWVESGCSDREMVTASIAHELVHYELQINCLINPMPSAFVNEGVAQAYAEGKYYRGRGSSYVAQWRNVHDKEWESKVKKALSDDQWFLENRMSDRTVGISNAALFEHLGLKFGWESLKTVFKQSRPNDSAQQYIAALCGVDPVVLIAEIASQQGAQPDAAAPVISDLSIRKFT